MTQDFFLDMAWHDTTQDGWGTYVGTVDLEFETPERPVCFLVSFFFFLISNLHKNTQFIQLIVDMIWYDSRQEKQVLISFLCNSCWTDPACVLIFYFQSTPDILPHSELIKRNLFLVPSFYLHWQMSPFCLCFVFLTCTKHMAIQYMFCTVER
jgi:hypothetical protein